MKIEAGKPNIVRISFHQEQGDPHYGSCMWAYFDFDLDKYMLNIQSDAGNAAYRWNATPDHESFLHLMARVNGDYLMNKLFDETVVDEEATKKALLECLTEMDMDEDDINDAADALEYIFDDYCVERNIGLAQAIVEKWTSDNDLCIDEAYSYVQTDFTAGEKRIVQIFADYIQPKIQELVKAGEQLGEVGNA